MPKSLSIVIPAKNEAEPLGQLLADIRREQADAEIIVVDDGSTDATASIAREAGAVVVSHPYSLGNGAAIKSGARAASGEIMVCMDADGQHQATDIQKLLDRLDDGFAMVVGARSSKAHASIFRRIANQVYNTLASWMVGHQVQDLTSGMRAVRTELFRQILPLLPNGFSYPTTSTMAFFRLGYQVGYQPIEVLSRTGKSHIRLFQDGFRFLLIIIKVGTLYSPLKIFVPTSGLFTLVGLAYYGYTYMTDGRFTNMGAVLLLAGIFIFLFGLLSEQVTTLMYLNNSNKNDR